MEKDKAVARIERVAKAAYEAATGLLWESCDEQNVVSWLRQAHLFIAQHDAAKEPA